MTTSSLPSTSTTKKVFFDEIEIFEFPYILGDNPAVSSGAPIALGFNLVDRTTIEVDMYEEIRGKRRSRKKLALPVEKRASLLLKNGYSLASIGQATLEANAISQERIQSANEKKWDRINEVSERFGRVIRKALAGGRKTVAANTA